MKLLDRYEAAGKVRRLAPRTIQTYRRWVEEFLRFDHDCTGVWIHPSQMGEPWRPFSRTWPLTDVSLRARGIKLWGSAAV